MTRSVLECRDYLSVDCSQVDGREMAAACRDLAVQCIAKQADRVLVQATCADPEGHLALRDALTAMLLAGIAPGFRLALVTDVPRVHILFDGLQRDLLVLHVQALTFVQASEAVGWLRLGPGTRPRQESASLAQA